MKRKFLIVSMLFIGLLFSCQDENSEDSAWEKAQSLKSIKAYTEFVKKFPKGEHSSDAMKTINDTYLKLSDDTTKLLSSFDNYKSDFPDGMLIGQLEEKIYQYAQPKGDSMVKVIYQSRFPNGKYIASSESTGEVSEASIYRELLQGKINLELFFQAYPQSKFLDEIETIMADSVESNPSVSLYEQYKKYFPEGNNLAKLGNMAEDIYYQEVVKKKSSKALQQFITEFPESTLLTEIVIDTKPSALEVVVTDSVGRNIQSFTTPGKMKVIEGMKLVVNASKEDFEPIQQEIVVEELNQNFEIELKPSLKYILFEKFENSTSPWARSGSDYTATIENGKLKLSTTTSQVEILKKQKVDFKRDFTLKMTFEFVKAQGRENNYVGLLWGNKSKIQYFFVDINGKAKSGIRENRAMSSENPMGYEGWSRSWLTAGTFKKNGVNEMIITKTGKKISYYLNGMTLSAFTLMNTPKDRFVGIGFGETEVLIDQISLKQ